jgi:hypothetical protein
VGHGHLVCLDAIPILHGEMIRRQQAMSGNVPGSG